jgi:hypothetical protein
MSIPAHGWRHEVCDTLVDLRRPEPNALADMIRPWMCCGATEVEVYPTKAGAVAALRQELLDRRAAECDAARIDNDPPTYDKAVVPVLDRIDKCLSILDAEDVLAFHKQRGEKYCFARHLIGPDRSEVQIVRAYDRLVAEGLLEPAENGAAVDLSYTWQRRPYRLKKHSRRAAANP